MISMKPGNPERRLRLFGGLMVIAAVIFTGRLFYFQVVEAEAINKVSINKREVKRTIPALRGDIVDAEGNVLAHSVYRYDINAAPINVAPLEVVRNGQSVIISVDEQATQIGAILGLTTAEVLEKIKGTSQYAQLAKNVDASKYRQLRKLNIPWLFYDPKLARVYPNGAVAGSVLGFMSQDGTPLAGVERQMNGCLAGVDGQETYEAGTDGIRIPASAVVAQKAQNGSRVVLTINRDLQYFAQQELSHAVLNLKADWATAVVIEVKTGKILVAAEAPTVDPNATGSSTEAARHSRIFETSFEPGSTMKTITAATAIDVGKATPLSRAVVPQSIRLPWGTLISDSHPHPTQHLTLTGILRDSSNTGIIAIGSKVDKQTRYNYMRKFGFGEKTSVNFGGEASGVLNKPENWDGTTDKVSMFGQGVSVTPIQMAFAYQAIANGGVRLAPTLIEGCQDASGKLTRVPVGPSTRVVSEQTAKTTVQMLEMVVQHGGIGRTAGLSDWRLGGKSGTAQIADGTGRYGNRYAISFIGMGAAEDPKYIVAVTIFKPRTVSNSIGATPYFKAIMKQVLQTYSVLPSTTKPVEIAQEW